MTARSFRSGRVFLAGDSAHAMPPTGGFGGNTGVADAHNLAWKLAFVTRGLAGTGLLDTYDAERRPMSALTVEQAYTRYALRVDPSLPRDDLMPPLDDAAIELGAIYRSTAVRADGPAGEPARRPAREVLDGRRPGAARGAPRHRRPDLHARHGERGIRVAGRGRACGVAGGGERS